MLNKQALGRLLARISNADRLLQHIVDSHTTREDIGAVAKKAEVKTVVLTYFTPGDDPALTDETWIEPVKTSFSGRVIAGKDLMEV